MDYKDNVEIDVLLRHNYHYPQLNYCFFIIYYVCVSIYHSVSIAQLHEITFVIIYVLLQYNFHP